VPVPTPAPRVLAAVAALFFTLPGALLPPRVGHGYGVHGHRVQRVGLAALAGLALASTPQQQSATGKSEIFRIPVTVTAIPAKAKAAIPAKPVSGTPTGHPQLGTIPFSASRSLEKFDGVLQVDLGRHRGVSCHAREMTARCSPF